MQKYLVSLGFILISTTLNAAQPEMIIHDVVKDRYVKSGTIKIRVKDTLAESVTMSLGYNILIKFFLIQKKLQGVKTIELPAKYLTPYGYEELEEAGRLVDEKITAIHLGRTNITHHYDCHKIKIIPTAQKDWDGIFTYCQDIASLGFAAVQVNMRNLPIIGKHTFYSKIRE